MSNDKEIQSTFHCTHCDSQFPGIRARDEHEYKVHGFADIFSEFDQRPNAIFGGSKTEKTPKSATIKSTTNANPSERLGLINVRHLRAELITGVEKLANGKYLVPSQTVDEIAYTVDLTKSTCTCPDYKYRGVPCKHLLAASYEAI